MSFQQLVIELGALDARTVEDALLELGAISITLTDAADQPLLEPAPGETPLWQHITLNALLPADTEPAAVLTALCARLQLAAPPVWHSQPLAEQDWTRAWLADFKPMRFGRRLWVVPSAYAPPEPDAVNLLLDPGLAFGTGTHPTTALCLRWLDGLSLAGIDVLDYGCGSGILAIAALKLGATCAHGVDNDPQALTAARDNALQNQVANRLALYTPEQLPTARYPVIVANILANPLVNLAPRFAELCAPGGQLALSGILADQETLVRNAYAPFFTLEPIQQQDEWLLMTGTRI